MSKAMRKRPLRSSQLTVRIPKRFLVELKATAERERRSVSDVVNIILEARYADRKPE